MSLYHVVACQTACPIVTTKEDLRKNVDYACEFIRGAQSTYSMTAPVKLAALPELALCRNPGVDAKERRKSAIEIPGEESERFIKLAKELDMYIMPGSWAEMDPEYHLLFNTAFLVGPEGLLLKYRKYNPAIAAEIQISPHDLLTTGYDLTKNPLFPVAKTEIGNIGVGICFDLSFPEVTRQLAYNGAEILIGATAWWDPYGSDTLGWWTACTRTRSFENMCYGLYVGNGASIEQFPPHGCSGFSSIVDFQGRVLTQVGRGEIMTCALWDINTLREYRKTTRQGNMLTMNRVEGYDYWKTPKRKMHPELAKKDNINFAELEKMEKETAEEFYSKYYGEAVQFPYLGEEWWRKFR